MESMRTAVFGYQDFLEQIKKEQSLDTLNNEERLRKLYHLSLAVNEP